MSSYSGGLGGPTYQDFKFYNKNATCNIKGLLGYSNSAEMIRRLVDDFKRAVTATNPRYAQHLVTAEELRKEHEIQRRKEEIEKLEKENGLNQMLKGLL